MHTISEIKVHEEVLKLLRMLPSNAYVREQIDIYTYTLVQMYSQEMVRTGTLH